MLCGRLPKSSDIKSVGMGKLAQAALSAAAGELDFAAGAGCLSFTTGFGLQQVTRLAPLKSLNRQGADHSHQHNHDHEQTWFQLLTEVISACSCFHSAHIQAESRAACQDRT